MTQTTTSYPACDVSLWIDNDAGTPVDVSGSSNSISPTWTNTVGRVSTFGASGWTKSNSGCLKSGTFSVTVLASTTAAEAYTTFVDWFFNHAGDARTMTWYEPDKNVGSHKYSGEARILSLTEALSSDTSDPVQLSIELESDGAWTWVTNAT